MADSSGFALPPPPGGDQNRGSQIIIVHSILSGIGAILVLLRLYVRMFIVKKLGMDDYFIVLALVGGGAHT